MGSSMSCPTMRTKPLPSVVEAAGLRAVEDLQAVAVEAVDQEEEDGPGQVVLPQEHLWLQR